MTTVWKLQEFCLLTFVIFIFFSKFKPSPDSWLYGPENDQDDQSDDEDSGEAGQDKNDDLGKERPKASKAKADPKEGKGSKKGKGPKDPKAKGKRPFWAKEESSRFRESASQRTRGFRRQGRHQDEDDDALAVINIYLPDWKSSQVPLQVLTFLKFLCL